MRTLFMIPLFVVAIGCNKQRVVQVVDASGKPIAGAKVSSVSPSFNGPPKLTDAKGEAIVESHVGLQDTQWIQVKKAGFQSLQVDYPTQWPFRVVLPLPLAAKIGKEVTLVGRYQRSAFSNTVGTASNQVFEFPPKFSTVTTLADQRDISGGFAEVELSTRGIPIDLKNQEGKLAAIEKVFGKMEQSSEYIYIPGYVTGLEENYVYIKLMNGKLIRDSKHPNDEIAVRGILKKHIPQPPQRIGPPINISDSFFPEEPNRSPDREYYYIENAFYVEK